MFRNFIITFQRSKLLKILSAPVVISVIISAIITGTFQYLITKMQISQQYNQAIIFKRQQLIENATQLTIDFAKLSFMQQQLEQNYKGAINLTKKLIIDNQGILLNDSDIESQGKLLELSESINKYKLSKLDSLKFNEYTANITKASSEISSKIDGLIAQYEVLSTMSKLYFGPKTQEAFNIAISTFANKSDESGTSFHSGLLINKCQKAMLSELSYDLK